MHSCPVSSGLVSNLAFKTNTSRQGSLLCNLSFGMSPNAPPIPLTKLAQLPFHFQEHLSTKFAI